MQTRLTPFAFAAASLPSGAERVNRFFPACTGNAAERPVCHLEIRGRKFVPPRQFQPAGAASYG